ncbi:MAG: hypothetical protein ACI9KE_002210 [Polyangiales bacterium]|jgi:hypothetical protein
MRLPTLPQTDTAIAPVIRRSSVPNTRVRYVIGPTCGPCHQFAPIFEEVFLGEKELKDPVDQIKSTPMSEIKTQLGIVD